MKNNIRVYSNGCPKCRVLEAKLAAKNIEYEKVQDVSEIVKMQFSSLPVMAIDGEYLNFAKANDWVNSQV